MDFPKVLLSAVHDVCKNKVRNRRAKVRSTNGLVVPRIKMEAAESLQQPGAKKACLTGQCAWGEC